MFRNLGREIYEETLNRTANDVLGKKKKDLLRILGEDAKFNLNNLKVMASRTGRTPKFENLKQALSFTLRYKNIAHYYVDTTGFENRQDTLNSNWSILRELGSYNTIEFNIDDETTIIAYFTDLSDDSKEDILWVDDKRVVATVYLFAKFNGYNYKKFFLAPATIAYILEDDSILYAYVDKHPVGRSTTHYTQLFRMDTLKFPIEIARDENELMRSYFGMTLVCAEQIVSVKNSVKIVKRKSITKSESSSKRVASSVKLNVVHIMSEDHLVPLQKYLYEYSESTRKPYQGGTHASPIPHERRGHYRKSRGKGDYILEDGEFKYVGDMKGNYSWVSATKVNENKKNNVVIYKA